MHVIARLNSRLNPAAASSTLDSRAFVSGLCENFKACARNGIAIEYHAEKPTKSRGLRQCR